MKRRFLCLTTSYPSVTEPNAGAFVMHLNRALIDQADQLDVVTYWRGGRLSDQVERSCRPHLSTTCVSEQIKSRGYTSISYAQVGGDALRGGAPDWMSAHPLKKLLWMPWSAWRLRGAYQRVIKRDRDESRRSEATSTLQVIAHWAVPSGLISARQRPVIYCHGGDVALLESMRGGREVAAYIARRARGVICVSEDLRARWDTLVQVTAQTSEVAPSFTLPMGITTPQPRPTSVKRWSAMTQGRLCIVTVGRLVEIKGYQLLLEALGRLSDEARAQLCWLAAGSGPEREKLESTAKSLKVPLYLLGELSASERDALLEVGDLFVAPSIQVGTRVEGAPLALREAALSGCPIITTQLGGARELVEQLPEGSAQLCTPHADDVHAAITRHLAQRQESSASSRARQAQATRDVARRLWSWEELGPRHAALITSLSEQDRPR